MISEIKNGQLSIDDLAQKYNFSDRTIQARIKELGFKWLAKEGKYDFVGDDESVFERDIDVVFESRTPSKSTSKSNTTSTNDIKDASNEVASTIQDAVDITPESERNNASNDTSKKGSTRNSKKTAHNASGGAIDNIDRLLAGKKAKKTYKGFYFDSDVLAVIDSVDNGIKSELINECLRKVFREKGLL